MATLSARLEKLETIATPEPSRLLGVWAAEEDENLQTFSDLSERRWLHYLDAGKGSGTPENVIFDGRFFCRPDS